ncbi:MAG: efflux RND transporter periplasmic adaptor subunit [Gammaproteobacteria bacterium]|nr:efflux RND transporter periplasmic adaptor subunit [Gammaproteobacteria bacterium]
MTAARFSGYLALGLAALTLAGCQPQSEQSAAPGGPPPPPMVDVKTLAPETVELSENSSGRVTAFRIAEVRPQISGIIQKRLFDEGTEVQQGMLLYQVDPAPYQAALDSAKAELAVVQANAEAANSKARRYQELLRKSAVSQQEADEVLAASKQAKAQIQAANAAVQSAQINLDYTRITAPISGIVGRSNFTEGALVSAQQTTALTTIRQLSPVYVDIKRNAIAATRSRQEGSDQVQEVTLTLEDGTVYNETGLLKFSESSVDQSTGMLNARALFENQDGLLLPGMFVRASLATETLEDALLAPQQGITRTPGGGTSALVVNADNVVEQREVTVSRTIGDRWLVSAGLNAGDRVIYSGLQKIKVGDTVQPLEDGKPANEEQH